MRKVYVMFGEPDENDDTKKVNAFEAVLEGNEVRIIMPTAAYTTCRAMAQSLEFQPYLIEGNIIGKDNNGQPVIINPTILEKLRFDKDKEIYICDSLTPIVIDESSPTREWTFWERLKASIYASY